MARDFGTACAAEGWRLVYGGGSRGLMGEAARAASAAGGAVLGVIPAALRRIEQDHQGLGAHTVLEVVDTLAERKARMAEAADAFITLPGGVGTLDELFEMITWNDLSIHDKPIVLCHDDGFWDPLLQWLERARGAGWRNRCPRPCNCCARRLRKISKKPIKTITYVNVCWAGWGRVRARAEDARLAPPF
jgi:uncharacterized protein (TIGR00730 family)